MSITDVILTKPLLKHRNQVLDFKQEMLLSTEYFHGCAGLEEIEYGDWLEFKRRFKENNWSPAEIFLYIRKSDNKVVGIIEYRHPLSEFLKEYSGNIGYSIVPSERGKGYGTMMLRRLLSYCRLYDEEILIACDKSNIASQKVILNNNGKLYREFEDKYDNYSITQQYKIKL